MRAEREDWFEAQDDLDPDSLVVLDQTAATTAMARRYGRAPRGERCRVGVPQGHWTRRAAKRKPRPSRPRSAPAVWSPRRCSTEATNGERFRTYVTDILVPALRPGDTVILDNLPGPQGRGRA